VIQLMVIAKAPVPGRVKTRLCPPCTPRGAATVAAAALADTVAVVAAAPAAARTLVMAGRYPSPDGWRQVSQRGEGLGERLAYAFADTAYLGTSSLLVGMDTPQVTPALLAAAAASLAAPEVDAVLGPADDGGWWALGLKDHGHAEVLPAVAMSTDRTGRDTLAALRARGLRVSLLPVLRDVDTAEDAAEVARLCPPDSRFAAAVAVTLPPRADR
jgi:rSAM/selenodomain-associated transferase 1